MLRGRSRGLPSEPTMTFILETIDLTKRFAGIVAANNVSLRIAGGARHALIGPNGAGKTTLINLLTGVQRPTSGRIVFDGAPTEVNDQILQRIYSRQGDEEVALNSKLVASMATRI